MKTYLLQEVDVFTTSIGFAERFEPHGSSRIAQHGLENVWGKEVGSTIGRS